MNPNPIPSDFLWLSLLLAIDRLLSIGIARIAFADALHTTKRKRNAGSGRNAAAMAVDLIPGVNHNPSEIFSSGVRGYDTTFWDINLGNPKD